MKVIELYPSFYCLCIKDHNNEEQVFIQKDITPGSKRCRLDLFESPETMRRWIQKEQELFEMNAQWGMHAIYERLYPRRIQSSEFHALIREKEEIDSVTIVNKKGVRLLYFRDDFIDGYDALTVSSQKLYAKEPIYIINRHRKLAEQNVLQKESYFVTYPEIATPLFSIGILEWAEDLIQRKPDQGYYIEQTTLSDLYMRMNLQAKDPGFFILSREDAPHYILRKHDIRNIIEGTFNT